MSPADEGFKFGAEVDKDHPFPGLVAFTEDASEYFSGREKETVELFRLVKRGALTVLFGRSGLGKTSLLQAGLFPRLRAERFLPIRIRLFYSGSEVDPVDQIKDAINEAIAEQEGLDAPTIGVHETLWEYFHRAQFWDPKNHLLTPVLVFDQFEEIFTVGAGTDARHLASELEDLIENRVPESVRAGLEESDGDMDYSRSSQNYRVLFSLREDYLPHLEEIAERIPSVMAQRMRLSRMNGEQAYQAVATPGGELINGQLARQIVRFVAAAAENEGEDSSGLSLRSLEVEPALLALVCFELNAKRLEEGLDTINANLLAGAKTEILNEFYRRSLEDCNPSVRAFVEDRLLTGSGFRGTVALEDALQIPELTKEVVDRLVDRRLVRIEMRLGIPHLELTHDVLTGVIQSHRDERIEKERIATEKERRRRLFRRLATVAGGMLILAVVMGVLALFALRMAQTQERLTFEAEEAKNDAQTAQAMAESRAEEALQRHSEALYSRGEAASARGDYPAAMSFLADALERNEANDDAAGLIVRLLAERNWAGHASPVVAARFLEGEATFLTITDDGSARRFDRGSGLPISDRFQWGDTVRLAVFSDDGGRVATIDLDDVVRVWDSRTGESVGPELIHTARVNFAAFSSDGKRIVAAAGDWRGPYGYAQVWNCETGQREGRRLPHRARVVHADFSSDGERVVTASWDRTGRIWSTETGQPLSGPLLHEDAVVFARFSPDGEHVVSTSWDKTARLWSGHTGEAIGEPLTHKRRSTTMATADFLYSGSTKWLATASSSWSDNTASIHVWDIANPHDPVKLNSGGFRLQGQVQSIEFGPDGDRLLTVASGSGLIWKPSTSISTSASAGPEGPASWVESPLLNMGRIRSASFSERGRVITASVDGTARVWDPSEPLPFSLGVSAPEPRHRLSAADPDLRADSVRLLTHLALHIGGRSSSEQREIQPILRDLFGQPMGSDLDPINLEIPNLEALARPDDVTSFLSTYLTQLSLRHLSHTAFLHLEKERSLVSVDGEAANKHALEAERISSVIEEIDTDYLREEVSSLFGNQSWEMLVAGDPQRALEASQQGLKIDPELAWIAGNQAHAYMLLGEPEKARAIYEEHCDKDLTILDGMPFSTATLGDFELFREEGLYVESMDEIVPLMEVAQERQKGRLSAAIVDFQDQLGWEDSSDAAREHWTDFVDRMQDSPKAVLGLLEDLAEEGVTLDQYSRARDYAGTRGITSILQHLFYRVKIDSGDELWTVEPVPESGWATQLALAKQGVRWDQASQEVKDWWHELERENEHRTGYLLELLGELEERESSVTDLFLAHVHGGANNFEATLHYVDYSRYYDQYKDEHPRLPEPHARIGARRDRHHIGIEEAAPWSQFEPEEGFPLEEDNFGRVQRELVVLADLVRELPTNPDHSRRLMKRLRQLEEFAGTGGPDARLTLAIAYFHNGYVDQAVELCEETAAALSGEEAREQRLRIKAHEAQFRAAERKFESAEGRSVKAAYDLVDDANGVSFDRYRFVDNGRLVEERVLLHAEAAPGVYVRSSLEYDDRGFPVGQRYLDGEGRMTPGPADFSSWSSTYHPNGSRKEVTRRGYDGSRGYSQRLETFDEEGRVLSVAFSDAEGRLTPGLNGFSSWSSTYYPNGSSKEVIRRGYDGSRRYSQSLETFDEEGRVLSVAFSDAEGGRVPDEEGVASIHWKYDELGRKISEQYKGADGLPVRRDGEYLTIDFGYHLDGEGSEHRYSGYPSTASHAEKVLGYGEDGKLERRLEIAHDDDDDETPARTLTLYDDQERAIVQDYQDETGQLVNDSAGYARVKAAYFDDGNMSFKAYFDASEDPALCERDYHRVDYTYTETGKRESEHFIGLDEKPVRCDEGFSSWVAKFDETGRRTEKLFKGYASRRYRDKRVSYDQKDRIVEVALLDGEGRPVASGYAFEEMRYGTDGEKRESVYRTANRTVLPFVGKSVNMGTASSGGTYHAMAESIAAVLPNGPELYLPESAGSVDNLMATLIGADDLSFVQGDVFDDAGRNSKVQTDTARIVASLHMEEIHILVRKDAGIASFADFAGKRVSAGREGSGSYFSAERLLRANGLTDGDPEFRFVSTDTALAELLAGELDAMFFTGGQPLGLLAQISAEEAEAIELLPVQVDEAQQYSDMLYYSVEIRAESYPWLQESVPALATPCLLIAHHETDEEIVREITRVLFEERDALERSHAKWEQVDIARSREMLAEGKREFHRGAELYFNGVVPAVDPLPVEASGNRR